MLPNTYSRTPYAYLVVYPYTAVCHVMRAVFVAVCHVTAHMNESC